MASNRSFKDYVASRFYNELFTAVEKYVEDNYIELDLRFYTVKTIGGVVLSDIEIKFVSINNLPEMKIEFDVAVEAELEVRESDYHYDESENCRQWFMLKCLGDLDSNLNDFIISNVTEYTSKDKQAKPMSDSLVPIIYKEELETVAIDFLRINYPDALQIPMAVEPQKMAKKMGLEIKIREITNDFSVFGQIYFHDCDTEFYDKNSGEMIQTHVDARTIFVDPNAYFFRNLGSVNNTIVHECVHWDQHRKAFELERLYDSSATRIKCKVLGGIKDNNRDATDWMEWQANALAPKIQMPLGMFKTKALEFIKLYHAEPDKTGLIDIMEPVIDALATFFCVSRTAAKIRMIDAGYEEAIGTFIYMDGHYVKPHKFKKGAIQRNQTFSIAALDAAIQSVTNTEMLNLVKDGSYQYVDSHFVLNHPRYLTQDENGVTILTNFARNNMEECCLVFNLSVKSDHKERYYSECFLNRDKTSNIDFDIIFCNGFEYATSERKSEILKEVMEDISRVYSELSTSFTKSLQVAIKWKGVTFTELEKRTMLSSKTISRIVNGESQGSINSIVLICLGLHLPPIISEYIIKSSPFSLNYYDKSQFVYAFALTHLYTKSMDEIRTFIQEQGADSL